MKKVIAKDATAGFLSGILMIVLSISFAGLIFSGVLRINLLDGIGLVLTGSVVIGLTMALFSSSPLTIASVQDNPSIIFAIMAGAIAHSMIGASSQSIFATVIMAILLTTVITALLMLTLGVARLGNLVRFVPYPVMAGFLAGTGWLIFQGGLRAVLHSPLTLQQLGTLMHPAALHYWLPALLLALILFGSQRLFKRPALIPIIIIMALVAFFLTVAFAKVPLANLSKAGWFLGPFPQGQFWHPLRWSVFSEANWLAISGQMGNMIAIVFVSIIALLLSNSSLILETRKEMNFNHELKFTGIANLAAVLLGGGCTGYQLLSGSVLNNRLGAKTRLSGIVAALICLLVLIFGMTALSYFPRFIVAGVLMYLGLDLLVKWLYEIWFKLPAIICIVALAIFLIIAYYGLLQGIILGVVITLMIFVFRYSRIRVIKNVLDGVMLHSNVERPMAVQSILRERGKVTYIVKLQGYLFFGNANTMVRSIIERLRDVHRSRLKFILVDFSLVNGMDFSSVSSLLHLCDITKEHEIQLVFTSMPKKAALELNQYFMTVHKMPNYLLFDDLDHGLEWCEEQLLKATVLYKPTLGKAANSLLALFPNKQDQQRISTFFEKLELPENQVIYRRNDSSDDLYFVESGTLEVLFEERGDLQARLKSLGAGNIVGEISLYLGAKRTATVITKTPCELYRLSKQAMHRLQQQYPAIAAQLHHFIACQSMVRMIHSNEVIRALL